MTLSDEFYKYLKELDSSNPIGLKAYGYDSPEVAKLQELATGKAISKEKGTKYKRVSQREADDYQLPWNYVDVKQIFKLRKERKIPLYKMAIAVGLSTTQYNRIEKGKVRMRESHLNRISRIFGVNRKELLLTKNIMSV